MNYLAETKAFYDWLETNQLSTSAIALWHALMHIANKTMWQDKFAVAVSVLEIKTGLKRQAVQNARNQLKNSGRITFESRTGSQSAIYSIIPFVDDKRPQSDTQGDTQPHTQGERINKHKLNVNETKQKKENCVKEKSNVSPPKEKKIRFGEYQHVLLKQSEYDKLIAEFLNAEELIKYLDEYIEMKGYKANSHYLAIRKWVVNAVNEQNERSIKASGNSQNSNQFARIYQEMEKEGGGLGF